MEEKLMTILNEICGAEEGELEADTDLFELGLLDSFGVVQLVVEIETQFSIILDLALLTREEIATPSLILQRIRQVNNE